MTLLEQTEKAMVADTRERAFLFTPDSNTILLEKEANEGTDLRCNGWGRLTKGKLEYAKELFKEYFRHGTHWNKMR